VLASADVDVVLAVVAVVTDVEDLMVGQGSHGSLGVGLIRDMHPERGVALAGGAEVQLEGVGSSVTARATRWARLRSAWNRSQLSRICWLV
jgi:hypothetical protein